MSTSHNAVPLDGSQAVDSPSGLSSTSDASPTGEPKEDGQASRPVLGGDGTSLQARENGSANFAGDASPAGASSAGESGNSSSAGNGAVGITGNASATSVHNNDGSKRSDITAAVPTLAAPAKDLPVSHVNPSDAGVGLQSGASVYSAGGHAGSPRSFSLTTAASTAASATTTEAFTALDSAAVGERGVLLHAAPHQVAVGVTDPSLGWVEVRAERVSGQIAAALTTGTAASHAALTSVLPTMATYLQEHHVAVQQVHVQSSLAGGQTGAGSQGQPSSQHDARKVIDNATTGNTPTNSWIAVPLGNTAIAGGQRNSFIKEGHHFSIRA